MFLKYHIEEIEHSLSEKKHVITRTGVDEIYDIASQSRRQEEEATHYASTATAQPTAGKQVSYPNEDMAYQNLDSKYHDMMNRKDST